MRRTTAILAITAVTALGPWSTLSASAYHDWTPEAELNSTIQSLQCPTLDDPGQIAVLGVSVILPVGFTVHAEPGPITCEQMAVGDSVEIDCLDLECVTAASVKWKGGASAEGPVAAAECSDESGFTLQSGVECLVTEDTVVKMLKSRKHYFGLFGRAADDRSGRHFFWPRPEPVSLFELLCDPATILGTTKGTRHVRCEGIDTGEGGILALKVTVEK